MGGAGRKQFALLAGVPVLARALAAFDGLPGLREVVVVLPPAELDRGRELLDAAGRRSAVCVAGGATRQESVRRGLDALGEVEVVLVHDAARPLLSPALPRRVLEVARSGAGAVPVLPVGDTLKRVQAGALATFPREGLLAAQTPQGFPRAMLLEAHRRAAAEGVTATDDAALCERCGFAVRAVEGEAANLKLTRPEDLDLAEALVQRLGGERSAGVHRERLGERSAGSHRERLGERSAGAHRDGGAGPAVRTGLGYDVHRLEEGRPCMIGGVRLDFPRGPAGHSDGDVLLHAVADALLGSAGEPDIGHRFPSGDPAWAGADSADLLRRVREAIEPRFEIAYVDAVVVAEAPRLAPHVPEIRRRIAGILGIDADLVNVKATTAEGLGAVGRGEGIAAQAVATLRERA
jgi:2-C-methyl-D-erythritol 4-phosphate cytidylyltransferase/2-C-methyl-D-erythritol 2,4-cyclodiphosphate synthase